MLHSSRVTSAAPLFVQVLRWAALVADVPDAEVMIKLMAQLRGPQAVHNVK
jgi:hypothetical protein